MQLRVAISQDFFTAFAAIPKKKQKKVTEFVSKFRENPQAPGINYEKINDAANSSYRSVRIDQEYRGIVMKPDKGRVYLILWVDKHDDAYSWARRHKCQVNPATGSLQIFETLRESKVTPPEIVPVERNSWCRPLFTCRDRELLKIGVPEELLPVVRSLNSEDDLNVISTQLPIEAYEALLFLASGIPMEEVLEEYAISVDPSINVEDIETALDRIISQRRFVVVDNENELQQMLEAPLEKWRVFLHPTQRRLVERDWNGPIRVLGGAGTGKTVVAMHRARWLVQNILKQDERLLFTTFSRNLVTDIEANLQKLCSKEEMQKIEVINIDTWLTRFFKHEGQKYQIVYLGEARFKRIFEGAMDLAPRNLNLPDTFYIEEWYQVILPQRLSNMQDYFRASRLGRGTPLSRKQRASIWPVFEKIRTQLHQKNYITDIDAAFLVSEIFNSNTIAKPYRCAIIDEAQDFGIETLQLIRSLVPESKNDIMVVGDGHQRIYNRRTSLAASGVNIRGRGRKLRLNYRTTEQIRRFATAVLEGLSIDDLDEGDDTLSGYRSLVQGHAPVIKSFPDNQSESQWVSEEVKRLIEHGTRPEDICIVGRTETEYRAIEKRLRDMKILIYPIKRGTSDNYQAPGVRIANMHRVKGLEFRIVFLVSINAGVLPLNIVLSNTEDPVEKRMRDLNERALLHVAGSRAINGLYVTWWGKPSPYLM